MLTGDKRYITPLVAYGHFLSSRYQLALSILSDPARIAREERKLLSVDDNDTEKRKRYNQHIAQFNGMGFYINLLVITNKIFSYHLQNTPLFPNTMLAIDAIKRQQDKFKAFVLEKNNIKIYGPQLINYVFYLHDLGIIDLKEQYTQQFKQVFPDSQDKYLSDEDYESKIYGMTHFITAASHYYKNHVEYEYYQWIIDYFEQNINQIIQRTENDVIAEVGICLMLVNHHHTQAINKIKSHLCQQYDPIHKLVKNKLDNIDFTYGEHRNILTVMLFKWPKKLMGDPSINQPFNKLLRQAINSTLKVSL